MNSSSHRCFRPSAPATPRLLLAVLAAAAFSGVGVSAQETDAEKKAKALQQRGDEQFKAGQFVEAEASFRQAMDLRQKLAADFPAVPAHRLELARMGNTLGEMQTLTGRYKKAQPPLRKAQALLEKLVTEFPDVVVYRRELLRNYRQLGQMYDASGKAKQAKEMKQKAKALESSLDDGAK